MEDHLEVVVVASQNVVAEVVEVVLEILESVEVVVEAVVAELVEVVVVLVEVYFEAPKSVVAVVLEVDLHLDLVLAELALVDPVVVVAFAAFVVER